MIWDNIETAKSGKIAGVDRLDRVKRLRLVVVLICGILLGSFVFPAQTYAVGIAYADSTANETSSAPGILFIGMSGLTPKNLDLSGNNLDEVMPDFSWAALSVRSFNPYTCATEGWLSLRAIGDVSDSTGRNLAREIGSTCLGMELLGKESWKDTPEPQPQPVTYAQFRKRTENLTLLTTPLFSKDTWAVGRDAGLAVASPQGKVSNWIPLPRSKEMRKDDFSLPGILYRINPDSDEIATDGNAPKIEPLTNAASLQKSWESILQRAPSDVVADLNPTDPALLNDYTYSTSILRIHQQLHAVLAANATQAQPRPVVIASLGDTRKDRTLQILAVQTRLLKGSTKSDAGIIASSTTKTEGLTTIADVRGIVALVRHQLDASTFLPEMNIPEIHVIPSVSNVKALSKAQSQQRQAETALNANAIWYKAFHFFGLTSAVLTLLWVIVSKHRPLRYSYWSIPLGLGLIGFGFVPAAQVLNFIPWWDFPLAQLPNGAPAVALTLSILISVILAGTAWKLRFPVSALAAVSLLVLCVDIILGSLHQRNGFMGSLVLSSRRYYGISNRTYDILIIASLLALLPFLTRLSARRAAIITTVLGVAVLAVDALPFWGADFGGPPGIILAFAIVVLLVMKVRLRWWYLLIWVAFTLMVMLGIGFISRHSDSHIGSFWSKMGSTQNHDLISGKIRDVLRSFTAYLDITILLFVVLALAIVGLVLYRHMRKTNPQGIAEIKAVVNAPGLGIVAGGILLGIAVAVPINDSGAMMLKEALYIVLPAFAAIIADWNRRSSSADRVVATAGEQVAGR